MQPLSESDPFLPQRLSMVEYQLRRRGIREERVLAAMEQVPRHEFIPEADRRHAYDDKPVLIGEGQTISQPYIVAAMVCALQVEPQSFVLEIGTGTGYQAAILSRLARQVYTVDRHESLTAEAKRIFAQLGYSNIEVITGDGSLGLPEYAPYDRVIVAAAAPTVPEPLIEQLSEGGRMVIPVGTQDSQVLQLLRKNQSEIFTSSLEAVRFVPLIGERGF